MQTRYKLLFFFICSSFLVLPACKKGYFDLNQNPNQVTTPSLPSLLSTATHKSGIKSIKIKKCDRATPKIKNPETFTDSLFQGFKIMGDEGLEPATNSLEGCESTN